MLDRFKYLGRPTANDATAYSTASYMLVEGKKKLSHGMSQLQIGQAASPNPIIGTIYRGICFYLRFGTG